MPHYNHCSLIANQAFDSDQIPGNRKLAPDMPRRRLYQVKILLTTERYESIVSSLSINEQIWSLREDRTAIQHGINVADLFRLLLTEFRNPRYYLADELHFRGPWQGSKKIDRRVTPRADHP
jgi:hypothetical protein